MYEKEKPKNDFRKTGIESYTQERSGCLSVFLIVVIAASVFFIFRGIQMVIELHHGSNRYYELLNGWLITDWMPDFMRVFLPDIALQFLMLVSAVALWRWKEWGYYGLILGYVITPVLRVAAGQFPLAAGGVVGLIILGGLVRHKPYLLE